MKNTAIVVVLLFVLIGSEVRGQAQQKKYAFKVLVNKGANEVKAGNSWQPLKVGSTLLETDEIRVQQNGYLGLVYQDGKPLEVKEAGKVKVSVLKERVKNSPTVLQKYTDFILSSNDTKRNSMTATGAVHRGGKEIPLFLPARGEQAVVYQNSVRISWDTTGLTGPFTVVLSSLFGDELLKVKTEENSIVVDFGRPEFKLEDNVLVKVVSEKDQRESADNFMIKKLSSSDRSRIRPEYEKISGAFAEESALKQYYLAAFYEEHKLLIDAVTAYQEAIALEPGVEEYRQAYEAFLVRTGMKTPAAK